MKEKQKLNSGNLVYAIILARSGSKAIKNKNIALLDNKPLISYPIKAALKSKLIEKVYVLTDSKKYAKISESFGAQIPFLRPKKISGDDSKDIESFLFLFNWLNKNNKKKPKTIVHLRATAPLITAKEIDESLKFFIRSKADSLKSINLAKDPPYKMWKIDKKGYLETFVKNSKHSELWNYPRQKLPQVYHQNAQIDIFRFDLLERKTISGKKIIPFILKNKIDIDDERDLLNAEILIQRKKRRKKLRFNL
jgi:CMP-N,N'-diacetyllegionaminic acid synthase